LTKPSLKRDVAAKTQYPAFNAMAFFHRDAPSNPLHDLDALRTTRPVHLRHAPIISETRALLQVFRDPLECLLLVELRFPLF
jgi:hypothetical protein